VSEVSGDKSTTKVVLIRKPPAIGNKVALSRSKSAIYTKRKKKKEKGTQQIDGTRAFNSAPSSRRRTPYGAGEAPPPPESRVREVTAETK